LAIDVSEAPADALRADTAEYTAVTSPLRINTMAMSNARRDESDDQRE
jgi:hypothetical protein